MFTIKERTKKNTKLFLPILSYTLFLIYFAIIGVIIPFLLSIPSEEGGFKTILSENDRYKMIDTFYDPEKFHDFRQNTGNINSLANFYNELEMSEDFKVLTVFNQALHVSDFRGDSRFYYNSEEFIKNTANSDINIKALQINKEAYDFYNIEIDSGKNIDWESLSLSYNGTLIPVLLGSDYKDIYRQGDIINGNFYSKDMGFEVIGFLKENSSIQYQIYSEFDLDTHIVIPYPEELWNVNNNFQFESILYFAMINCDILPNVDETQLLKKMKEIMERTGFTGFSLVGIDNFQIQNIELLLFIKEHQSVVILILTVLLIFLSILSIFMYRLVLNQHPLEYEENWRNYLNRYKKYFIYYVGVPYGITFLLGLFFSTLFLKKFIVIGIVIECLVLLLIYIGVYLTGIIAAKNMRK